MRFSTKQFFLTASVLLATTALGSAQTETPAADPQPAVPVEVAADALSVNQDDGTAAFTGDVLITQGDITLTADRVDVTYVKNDTGTGTKIETLVATGNVKFVNGDQTAQADSAVYSLESGVIVMEGNAVLTQGDNAVTGAKVSINISDGSAVFSGRVKTVIEQGGASN